MGEPLLIGGAPVVQLHAADAPPTGPAFLSASVLPGRGMMLLQARLRLASAAETDALFAPGPEEAARALDGGVEDFAGNRAFSFGGAILAPFANRIRGRPLAASREIETAIDGHKIKLPRNWGGKAPGAAQYAMHGLILDANVSWSRPAPNRLAGRLEAGDFRGRWPSRARLDFAWRLKRGGLELSVIARNLGAEPLPIGLGWHPYFRIPSGQRPQVRLRLPAARRVEVNDYDEVLPTGRLLEVRGGPYDFSAPGGASLGELYLDDCFTELRRRRGRVEVEVRDPAAGLGLRITSPTPEVRAVQVYAPPDKAFVVVEPQFNLADPYGEVWPPEVDTGMAHVPPGGSLGYQVRVEPFVPENPPLG